jgi:hypothetical protein
MDHRIAAIRNARDCGAYRDRQPRRLWLAWILSAKTAYLASKGTGTVSDIYHDAYQHENGISVLYATEHAIVYAYAPADGLRDAVDKLRDGVEPTDLLPEDAAIIKPSRIIAIEQMPTGDGIVIRHRGRRKVTSTECTGHRDLEIAEILARMVGISSPPTTRMATLGEVSFLPGGIMAMAAPAAAIIIGLALTWDPSDVDMGSGKARMFADVMDLLGATGVCILAGIPVLVVAGWWAVAYIRRPTVTVFRRAP